jgi:hypothetical protein
MNNARKPEESLEDYHTRLREEQKATDLKLADKLVWNSTEQGTYRKPKDETPEQK